MTSKLHLVWLVLLAAIASLAAPSYAETRVGAFEFQEAEFTRAERVLNETCIEAYAVSSGQLAVGCPHAPRGTARPGDLLPGNEIVTFARGNKPGDFILRPGVDDRPLGVVTQPGKSASIATDLRIRTEFSQAFGAERGLRRGDTLSGAFVEDINAAGFDVVFAPTAKNGKHVRIIARDGTNFDESGRDLLSLAFDRLSRVRNPKKVP